MADNKLTIQERDIVHLLRDFLEEAGHAECLAAFEKCTGSYPSSLERVPELVSLRRLVLSGRLEELQEHFLEQFKDSVAKEELQRCIYELVKQQYLELYLQVTEETSDSLKQLLTQLERLCPSRKEFKALLSLLTIPSLDHAPEFKGWTVHKGRLHCFNQLTSSMNNLVSAMVKPQAPTISCTPPNLSKNRLVQLVAKGLKYEHCEALCVNSQAEDRRKPGRVLDLYNWIKHQPDSAFQLSPTSAQLVVTTETGDCGRGSSKVDQSESGQSLKSLATSDNVSQPKAPPLPKEVERVMKEEYMTGRATVSSGEKDDRRKPVSAPMKPHTEETTSSAATSQVVPVMLTADLMDNFVDNGSGVSGKLEAGSHRSEVNLLERKNLHGDDALPSSTSTPALQTKAVPVARKHKQLERVTVSDTPEEVMKKGRKSSTPKPCSSQHQLSDHPSPSTSPVLYASPSHRFSSERLSVPAARRQIDFSENDESVVFPSVKLLVHVKDKQVIRSVAFSESGALVAIGANSRTLRLCSTEPLFQEDSRCMDKPLPILHCAQEYHKGSIYCLAWCGDMLLASGSNDQTIRLLSYDPTSPTSMFTSLTQLKCHKGTVRDLTFTSDGLLLSGGVGNNLIKASNPETGQVVNTFYGHYDEIHSLSVVRENVLASASQDKTVKLWDIRQGTSFATIQLPHPVTSVASNVHLNQLACAQLDGSCVIHNLSTHQHIVTYNAHSDECRTVRYSTFDDGRWLLSSSYDGTVCLADTTTWEWQQVAQHRNKVVQCRWHSTAPVFASTGADNKASFWRLEV